jgi:hypothetical protein
MENKKLCDFENIYQTKICCFSRTLMPKLENKEKYFSVGNCTLSYMNEEVYLEKNIYYIRVFFILEYLGKLEKIIFSFNLLETNLHDSGIVLIKTEKQQTFYLSLIINGKITDKRLFNF